MLAELDAHTREAVARDGFQDGGQGMHDKWLLVPIVLVNNGFPVEARVAAQRLYQVIRSFEVERTERFKKGTLLWWLGRTCQEGGAPEHAKNYFLLAMLDDVRTDSNTWQRLPARDWLVNRIQLSSEAIDYIGNTFATDVLKSAWEPREPEIAWVRSRPHRRRITLGNLDFSKAVAGAFREAVDAPADTSKEKGDRLEHMVSYLFAVEPGWEVLGPTKAPDSQNDVLVRNGHLDAAIAALGDYFLVECKNWNEPVGAPIVRELAGKMRAAKVRTGVLVSKEGITGETARSSGTAARETIAKEYLQDETAVLVLTDRHLGAICEGRSLLSLECLNQFEKVRFDIRGEY